MKAILNLPLLDFKSLDNYIDDEIWHKLHERFTSEDNYTIMFSVIKQLMEEKTAKYVDMLGRRNNLSPI